MTYQPGDLASTPLDLLEDSQLRELGSDEALEELAERRRVREAMAERARAHLRDIHRTTA